MAVSRGAPLVPDLATTPDRGTLSRAWRLAGKGENLVLVTALAAMLLLPVTEILLRQVFKTGISGSSAIVQHLTLIVGMLGGAIAARDRRLLALSPVQTLLTGRARWRRRSSAAASRPRSAFFLFLASLQYVLALKPLGKILVYGIPVWVIQLFPALGFGLIMLRLVWHASEKYGGAAWRSRWPPQPSARRSGRPVLPNADGSSAGGSGAGDLAGRAGVHGVGGCGADFVLGHDLPIQAVPLKHYSLTTNNMLPSIPIFTLAGYFLAESGASKRLVRVFQALVGQFRGGPAIVTALVCAFFTSFTGASGVTILALGGVLMPVLLAARYSERNALGLLTGAGSLGMLFPPCLPLILYAIVANHSAHADLTIKEMFLGGIGPGILLVIIDRLVGYPKGPKEASDRPGLPLVRSLGPRSGMPSGKC
jgi:C4-dicarboxylate transporter DctM subunit